MSFHVLQRRRPPRQVDDYEDTVRTFGDGVQEFDRHPVHQLRVLEESTRDPDLVRRDAIESFAQEVLRLHNVCRALHGSVRSRFLTIIKTGIF